MATVPVRFTDSAYMGTPVVVLVINSFGEVLNFDTQAFGSRVAESEAPLTELSDLGLEGMHVADVTIPDGATDLVYRVEEAGDDTHAPIATGALTLLQGHISNLADILDVVIPGSGLDGRPDITIGRAQLELLSFGKGMFRIDKASRTATRHLAGTNEVLRSFRVIDDETQAALVPPDVT